MERAQREFDMDSFSLSQTTLDDVFVYFVSQQSEDAGLDLTDADTVHSNPRLEVDLVEMPTSSQQNQLGRNSLRIALEESDL